MFENTELILIEVGNDKTKKNTGEIDRKNNF